MDPRTIQEAQRLLHDLVFTGQATTSSGKLIVPKDEVLVTLLEKIANKKVEEPTVAPDIADYLPQETYREKPLEKSPSREAPTDR